jgi:DNA polymerase
MDPRILSELGLGPRWVRRVADAAAVADTPPARTDDARAGAPSAPAAEPPAGAAAAVASAGIEPASRARTIAAMEWPALEAAVAGCTACGLCTTRTNAVLGVGDRQADWMFIGEGPGAEEDARGEPFVGQAGRLLDNMLAAIGLERSRGVYIGNIVKCRPPGNRNPEPVEAGACMPFLRRQIALVQPRLIVALGKVAAANLLGGDASIASLRGKVHDCDGRPLVVTYHPAYLLRNLPDKAKAWEDLCFARDIIAAQPGRDSS